MSAKEKQKFALGLYNVVEQPQQNKLEPSLLHVYQILILLIQIS